MRDTVILTTLESDTGGIVVPGQPEQRKVYDSPSQQKKTGCGTPVIPATWRSKK
jgi:hypothetical protein